MLLPSQMLQILMDVEIWLHIILTVMPSPTLVSVLSLQGSEYSYDVATQGQRCTLRRRTRAMDRLGCTWMWPMPGMTFIMGWPIGSCFAGRTQRVWRNSLVSRALSLVLAIRFMHRKFL